MVQSRVRLLWFQFARSIGFHHLQQVLLCALFSGVCVFWDIISLPCQADQLGSPLEHSANPLRRAGAPHSPAPRPSCFPQQWLLPHTSSYSSRPGERTASPLPTNIHSTLIWSHIPQPPSAPDAESHLVKAKAVDPGLGPS